MPRDAAGTYTLPVGNPVLAGTLIESAWANSTLSDIKNALTDSLSRTGQGGMLSPFFNADGLIAAPGISWINQPTAGWYRAALNDFRYAIAGADIFQLTGTSVVAFKQLVPLGNIYAPDGNVGAPSFSFQNDGGLGWYRSSTHQMAAAVNGVPILSIDSTTVGINANLEVGGGLHVLGTINTPSNVVFGGTLTVTGALNAQNILSVASSAHIAGVVFGQSFWSSATAGSSPSTGVVGAYYHPTGITINGSSFGGYNVNANNGLTEISVFSFSPGSGGRYNYIFSCLDGGGKAYFLSSGIGSGVRGLTVAVTDDPPTHNLMAIDMGESNTNVDSFIKFDTMASTAFRTHAAVMRNPGETAQAQFSVYGGRTPTAVNAQYCGLVVNTQSVGGDASIGFLDASGGNIIESNASTLYVSQHGGGGPVSGWIMSVSASAVTANAFTPVSDRAVKENIRPLEDSLARVLQLKPSRYYSPFSQSESIGFVAQDVEEVFPELVAIIYPAGENPQPLATLNYMALVAPLVRAVQELTARIEVLEAR